MIETLPKIDEFWHPQRRKCYYWERRLILESLQKLSRHVRGGRLLDVGCGRKPYLPLFHSQLESYWGVDYPVTMVNSYREATQADAFADCLRLPFRDAVFDTVLNTQVLEHVPNPGRLVGELARVLKPGGILILSAPMTWPLHEEPYDFYRYTTYGLRSILSQSGLEVVEEIQRGGSMLTLSQVFLDAELGGHHTGGALWRVYSNFLCLLVNSLGAVLDRLHYNRRLCLGLSIAARKPEVG